ncbi:MAG: sortase [Lachnospiraceae bacterium]|nr:sortase [Lachnospiraceae bacterium]
MEKRTFRETGGTKKKGRKLFLVFGALFFVAAISAALISVHLLSNPEEEAFQRQHEEEDLADAYIKAALNGSLSGYREKIDGFKRSGAYERNESEVSEKEAEGGTEAADDPEPDDFSDDVWYARDGVTYTPDYAHGYVECVLEIVNERVKIRRGIYSGTWDDIYFDLDIWMAVAARPDYELGKTHYCIYGHNHPVQDLSFNRLRYTEKDDVFRLYTADTVYEYRVTRDPFPLSREEAAVLLTDNFELSAEYCYILTCGRDEHRYMDTVVEGKLQETYTAEAWKALGGKKTEKQE